MKPRWGRIIPALAITIALGSAAVQTIVPEKAEAQGPQQYIEVTMWEGGTLWQVAEKHNPNNRHDVREVLYEDIFIMQGDEIVDYEDFRISDLRAGHTILVAVGE